MENSKKLDANSKNMLWITGFGLLTIVLWNIPGGMLILYPFTILGTWFHEMGHGLTAEILGGNFIQLVLFADGSGYAQFSYDSLLFANLGKALVAAGGPLGPTIAGSIFLISSINLRATRIILFIFALMLLISFLIWVRPFFSFGFAISAVFAFVFGWIALYGKDGLKVLTLRFIGIQAFASVYQSIGYLYSSGGVVDGKQFCSDTQIIAENIFLPVWLSATVILLLSILSVYYSVRFILKKS